MNPMNPKNPIDSVDAGAGATARNDDTAGLPPPPEVSHTEVGLLQNFCTILSCPQTGDAALVDPAWEVDRLLRECRERRLRVVKVLVTHGHNDHVEGIAETVRATGSSVVVNARELERVQAALGGVPARIDCVADREDVAIGRCGVRALETRGHTVGGTCFLADGYVVTGDVLFVGGCGRTDFVGGNVTEMWHSLQRLAALPEETRVYPGHNYGRTETSTIGRELLENRFLRCDGLESFKALRQR